MLSQNSAGSRWLYYEGEGERIYTGDIAASATADFDQLFLLFSPHIPIYYRRAVIFTLPVSQSYLENKIKLDT